MLWALYMLSVYLQSACECILQSFKESDKGGLLVFAELCGLLHEYFLDFSQFAAEIIFRGEKLGERDVKSSADLFKGRNRGDHVFAVPG